MNKYTTIKYHNVKLALVSAVAIAATTLSGGAGAANNASATATATVVAPISINKATDLVFGNFYSGASAGTVVVSTSGARSFTGGVLTASGGATPAAAKFDITGAANATYTIAYDSGVMLTSGTDTMALTQVSDLSGANGTTGLVATGTLSAGGTQSLYIGGSLAVAINQPAGAYSGNLTATVNYN